MSMVLFVPGFKEGMNDRNYPATLQAIESRGYSTEFVPINWSRTTVNDWVKEFETTYGNHNPNNTIIAGFSYGAVTAFLAASKREPKQLWLFSLSARFHEDLPKLPKKTIKRIGKHRLEAFGDLHFSTLAKSIRCKTLIFIGEEEVENNPQMLARSEAANRSIKDSKLIFMPGVPHDATDTRYLRAIGENIA